MSSSENAEFMDAAARVFDQMGQRANNEALTTHLLASLPPHLRAYIMRIGVSRKVGEFFRQRTTDGLAIAPEIDEHGTHADLALLDEHEFRYVVARHVRAGKSSFRIAKQYAELAHDRLGVEISLTDPLEESA